MDLQSLLTEEVLTSLGKVPTLRPMEILSTSSEMDCETIDRKIRIGTAELERGEGIAEENLDAYLDWLKALPDSLRSG